MARDEILWRRIDGFGVGTWDLDLETWDLVWSDTTRDLFGVARDQAVTYELFLSLLADEDRARTAAAVQAVAATGGRFDVSVKLRGGNPQWIRARASVVDDRAGTARHL